jgi:hypothetical protein
MALPLVVLVAAVEATTAPLVLLQLLPTLVVVAVVALTVEMLVVLDMTVVLVPQVL